MGAQYEQQAREAQADVDVKSRSGPFGSEAAIEALRSMISATNSWYSTLFRDHVSGRRDGGVGRGGRHGRDPSSVCNGHSYGWWPKIDFARTRFQ